MGKKKTTSNKKLKKKNPWIAAFLNIIPGIGYLYSGKRRIFAYLLLSSFFVAFIDGFIDGFLQSEAEFPTPPPLSYIILIIFLFAFVYDAFNNTKETKHMKIRNKNPWIAAILNIIPGLGYLYLGKRRIFAILLLLTTLLGMLFSYLGFLKEVPITPLYGISLIIYFIAYVYDAYEEAKE